MENLPTTGRTDNRYGQVAGNSRSTKPRESVCTAGDFADGFLSTQFLPLYCRSDEPLQYNETTEQDFFKSCSELAVANGIELFDVKNQPYPYNIALSYWDIFRQLERNGITLNLDIVQLEDSTTTLVTSQIYEISYMVYHIPVLPLHRLLKNPQHRATCNLLLSVYSYLYHNASIPYYRDSSSSIGELYDMFESFAKEDWEDSSKEDYEAEIQIFKDAKRIGNSIEKRIYNLKHLEELPSRIANYSPSNQAEKSCLKIAKTALFLLREFPDCNIMRNMSHEDPDLEREDPDFDYYDEGWVCADQIFSFVYSTDNDLSSKVVSFISDDFGNKGIADQPRAYRVYNKGNEQPIGLEYEVILINLIEDLCTLLNVLK